MVAEATGDRNLLHLDEDYARATILGGRIVSSTIRSSATGITIAELLIMRIAVPTPRSSLDTLQGEDDRLAIALGNHAHPA